MLKDKGLVRLAHASIDDIRANQAAINSGKGKKLSSVNTATWFLPVVTHALKGGVRTVFMFAERMSIKWGTVNMLIMYAHNGVDFDVREITESLSQHFPRMRFVVRKFVNGQTSINELPRSEVAFCTLWTTAYLLLKYNRVIKKFYFMQDYEPLFYEAGSVYAAIEQTYRFGFSCIANTPGVGNRYLAYSPDMVSFFPGIDKDVFYPQSREVKLKPVRRVVFYGRPGNARNCFSLGVMTLQALKRKMKDRVEIISVGAEWDVKEYGLEGVVDNWGLLNSLTAVADLYRSSDVGLVFMVTPHPSYQPFEYMACGCLVATNVNEANRWLLDEHNSVQVEPVPEIAAQRILDVLSDEAAMARIREKAFATIAKYDWDSAYAVFERRLLGDST
ncbi:hypothetical protein GCM10027343_01660 [Noviherbaspirillum agri]